MKFAFVQNTVTGSHTALMDDIIRQGLLQLVEEAELATKELESLQEKLEECGSFLQRTRWAIKDARTVKSVLTKVENVEDGLSKWIHYVSLKGHTATLQQIDAAKRNLATGFQETQQLFLLKFQEMEQMLSTVTISCRTPGATSSSPTPPTNAMSGIASRSTANATPLAVVKRVFTEEPWDLSERWQSWGLRGSVIKSKQGSYTDYDATFAFSLPLAWLLGKYSLNGQLSFRTSHLWQNTLKLRHPSYFTVARVVETSHPFMKACRYNDIDTVRMMLRNGEGRPTDRTPVGESPMCCAIRSGSSDIVAELLENGADIDDGTLNSHHMTALEIAVWSQQLDIMRSLLNRGASQDHYERQGFNSSLLCWSRRQSDREFAIDMFNLLNEYALQDTDYSTGLGITFTHIAAAASDGAVIAYLFRLGVAIHKNDAFGYSPLCYAVRFGNPATYSALMSHDVVNGNIQKHEHPLLHLAIMGKHADLVFERVMPDHEFIVRDLLNRGVDPSVPSDPRMTGLFLESMEGRSVTPQELAAAVGPQAEAWFMAILRDCGFLNAQADIDRLQDLEAQGYVTQGHVIGEEVSDPEGEESGDDASEAGKEEDIFWDAEEGV